MEALSQVSYRPDSEIYINKNNQINQQLMIKGDTPFDASPYKYKDNKLLSLNIMIDWSKDGVICRDC